jgi:hypothetical protein
MRFAPKTDEEIATDNLLAAGEYDFEVRGAVDDVSKKGNDMIKLTLAVFDDAGSFRTITDYLLESLAYKLKHACEAVGLSAAYEAGEVEALDFVGKSGRCKVKVDPAKDGYPAKNSIADYIGVKQVAKPASRPPAARQPVGAGVGPDLDDEIPFAACWQ